jgi:hypothetical protein
MADVAALPARDRHGMATTKLFLGFVPWFVYTVVVNWAGTAAVPVAAFLAFAAAVGLVVRARMRGESAKLLEVTGAVVFAAYGVVALVAPAADAFLAGYGRALAALLLAVVIFALLPVRPFTEQYAREAVPREYWGSSKFHAINRRISAAWGGVVLAMAAGHVLATLLAPQLGRPADLLFNWGVPVLLIILAARYTARVTGDDDRPQAVPDSGAA